MNIEGPSATCIALIKCEEGCALKSYWDVDGYSIGYGHHSDDITESTVWTGDRADSQLLIDAQDAFNQMCDLTTVELTQGQADALTDFVYNLGSGQYENSTLRKLVNTSQFSLVPSEFLKWHFVDGTSNPSLATRRAADVQLWES